MAAAVPLELRSSGGPDAPAIPATVETGLVAGDAPLTVGDGGGTEAVTTSEGFWQYSTTSMPARGVGRLFFRSWAPELQRFYDSSCSAAITSANNRALVWTAGHCVYETYSNVWGRDFVFCPGYRDSDGVPWESRDCPLGRWTARDASTTQQWVDAVCTSGGSCALNEFWGDFGALVMNRRSGRLIEKRDRANSHPLQFNQTTGDVYSFGYPATASSYYRFNGRYLYWCVANSRWTSSSTRRIPCHATGGASGGPWLGPWNSAGRSYLTSVNSHGGSSTMGAPYQGLWAQKLYDYAQNL